MYNLKYYENMLRLYSKSAEMISKIRWDFVKETDAKLVLDYGSGCGWFRAFAPEGITVDSFDIGLYPQTGINHKEYDLVTFWDVLEHIPNFRSIEPVLNSCKWAALTIPIKPEFVDLKDWKHFKPNEHLHYFTIETLVILFENYGFKLNNSGTPECPPREDVISFLFERVATETQRTLREN